MRLFAVLMAVCGISQTAIAQTLECKSISEASARLACYDKAAPPAASAVTAKTAAPASTKAPAAKVDRSKFVDTIGAEDALMNARLKNICRGC